MFCGLVPANRNREQNLTFEVYTSSADLAGATTTISPILKFAMTMTMTVSRMMKMHFQTTLRRRLILTMTALNKADPDDDNDGLSDVTEVEIEAIRYSLILTAIP